MFSSIESWGSERSLRFLKWINIISFIAFIVGTFLVYGDFIGTPIRLVTEKFVTFLTPAHWAFKLLNLVVFFQLLFTIYQALPDDPQKTPYLARLSFYLPVTWLFETAAVISMAFEVIWLSFFFVTFAMIFLAIGYARLNSIPLELGQIMSARIDGREKACASFYYMIFYAPTAMNLALLVVGWVLSLFITIGSFGHDIPSALPVIASCIAAVVGLVMLGAKRDVIFGLTVSWCLFSVALRWMDLKVIFITNILASSVLFLGSIIAFGVSARKENLLEKEEIGYGRIKTSHTGIHSESSRLVSSL